MIRAILALGLATGCMAASAQAAPAPGDSREVAGIEFVWCPPGEYMQGAETSPEDIAERFGGRPEWYSDELPRRRREIADGFWIGKTEVTKQQWNDTMNTRPWEADAKDAAPDTPAVTIAWEDARDFARKFGERADAVCRLPTETEWEYACRAGSETAFHCGDTTDDLPRYVQYRLTTPDNQPQPVAKRGPNAWNLHDVHGNVWEWCFDKYATYTAPPRDPAGAHYRIIRGGAAHCTAAYLRSSYRVGVPADLRSPRIGFRVVIEAE